MTKTQYNRSLDNLFTAAADLGLTYNSHSYVTNTVHAYQVQHKNVTMVANSQRSGSNQVAVVCHNNWLETCS